MLRKAVSETGVQVTRLGLGGAGIGAIAEDHALDILDRAWAMGVRYFDTAPVYGSGASEQRIGAALRNRPRREYVISTKVGRQIAPAPGFDFTEGAVHRSIEASLERLAVDSIDIAFLHDPDEHWRTAIGEATPSLHRLREQGVVSAVGVGMSSVELLLRFAREGDFDAFLVAGRYSLLDQSALGELLPECGSRGIAVIVGGVFNSGILAGPRVSPRFDYIDAPRPMIERALRLEHICKAFDVPLRAAALQFPLAHPVVASVLAGPTSVREIDEFTDLLAVAIPDALWEAFKTEGLLHVDTPTPGLGCDSESTPA